MKKEISDRYEPNSVEEKWILYWEKNSSFLPNKNSKETFSIVIPPPNVTGTLHIGHALNHTIQDIIIRIERKKGKNTVWVPGMDHAGIATQVVVERELAKEGKKRLDFTRENFQEKVWEWKRKSGGQITHQQKKLGESVDWSQERFTMDAGLSKAVIKAFTSLYDEGLIYRGEKLINWSPKAKTAISDIEVEFKEVQGKLYHIRYPIKNTKEFVVVATTRPETMLGDVAVCAHPEDKRYAKLKDSVLELPLTNREIPLLFDSFVDKEFGSGLVKITPAHDFNDYEAGQRLGLKPINIFHPDATINENGGSYSGLDRFEARKKIVSDLEKLNLIEKIEDHTHSVGHNQRGGDIIEPYLSTQWFVKVEPLAKKAIDAVRSGKIEFIPKMWEKTYFEWMENIKDWCISRQLWWGHRIPAWYCVGDEQCKLECKSPIVSETPPEKCPHCGSKNLKQDEDVLDTWFSSGLWPFSVFGWPEKTDELKMYYPNSILVTAFDIIFFWVARMIMFGLKFMNDVPFKKVIIHSLVRDKSGKKFSKSLGNTVDPLEMMAIYGTDSFRFFLAATLPEGKDILFDEKRLDGYRSFANKIWNSSRFIVMSLSENFTIKDLSKENLESSDLWILHRFNLCLEKYEKSFSEYRFYEMADSIYQFFWGDFCDWYIELTKSRIYGKESLQSKELAEQVLVQTLLAGLCLLNPMMPFITEEIHSIFSDKNLANKEWIKKFTVNDFNSIKKIDLLQEIVGEVRRTRSELNVPLDKKCKIILKSIDPLVRELAIEEKDSILQLAKAESLDIFHNHDISKSDSVIPFSKGEIILPLSGIMDFEKEKQRLKKEDESIKIEISKIQTKLTNAQFLEKAKPEIIDKEKEKLKVLQDKLFTIQEGFKKFET
ncbi:MAG: valine--tRNA ligase [Leptospiraceae bacterium]|nr:valine--tRNA ligase [Leptospiraceae bacterium]MCK6380022.1 valine--tRNA ligase [Leptospiraceae bacterium]NUM40325.1 valine--tRNA ligase [Leptospiraceae bacterium]